MKSLSLRSSLLFLFAAVSFAATLVQAQIDPAAVSTSKNDFYTVHVVDHDVVANDSIGSYQARTGPLHPVGDALDINYASSPSGVNIGTSFSGIRIKGDRAYTMDMHGSGSASAVNNLDPYFVSDGPTPGFPGTGWRTVWDIKSELIQIVQDFIVVGSSASDAVIYHTVEIKNQTGESTTVEWFNLMDFGLETDSGPTNQIVHENGFDITPIMHHEFQHVGKTGEMVKISDSTGAGNYDVYWSLSYDPGYQPVLEGTPLVVTQPIRYKFAQWATAYNPANFSIPENVFDYVVDTSKIITGEGGSINDAAGIANFAAAIPADGSARFTQVIFVRPVPEPSSLLLALTSGTIVLILGVNRKCKAEKR